MGPAEKKIADWLLDNQGEIISLSISGSSIDVVEV